MKQAVVLFGLAVFALIWTAADLETAQSRATTDVGWIRGSIWAVGFAWAGLLLIIAGWLELIADELRRRRPDSESE